MQQSHQYDRNNESCWPHNPNIHSLPPNTPHLLQPCVSFVIQKIECKRNQRWERFRLEMVQKCQWKDSSAIIQIHGKQLFLKLAAVVFRECNWMRDENGPGYVRKAVIMTEMALNTNCSWEVEQLSPELRRIMKEKKSHLMTLLIVSKSPLNHYRMMR